MTSLELLINLFIVLGFKINKVTINYSSHFETPETIELLVEQSTTSREEHISKGIIELGFAPMMFEGQDDGYLVTIDCTSVNIFHFIETKPIDWVEVKPNN